MDDMERQLKTDAEAIRADITPELEARLRASLHAASPARTTGRRRPRRYLWLAGALTGTAAAAAALMLLSLRQGTVEAPPPADAVAVTVPAWADPGFDRLPLTIENAELTRPLEEELERLRSDLERARENVEEDIRFSF